MTAEKRDLLMVGRIIRSHGVHGEVKVLPESDDPERLLALSEIFVGRDEATATCHVVESARFQQSKKGLAVLMKLKDVSGRDRADALRQQVVFATKDDLPPLEEGEFFLHDVIGSRVETDAGDEVGVVKDVLALPAHNVYVIKSEGRGDVMVPAVPAFIEKVDVDAHLIVIRPIEGLLDS